MNYDVDVRCSQGEGGRKPGEVRICLRERRNEGQRCSQTEDVGKKGKLEW